MRALATIRRRFVSNLFPPRRRLKPLPRSTAARSFSSSLSPSEYPNQSRGGLLRFFSDRLPSSKGGVVRLQGDEFHHMTRVLRLTTDDRVELFNGNGSLVEGCIQSISRAGVDVMALGDPKFVPYPSTKWHVFAAFGTLKGGRADWLVEKCSELGACSVTPLLTDHSPLISDNRVDRLQRVILAATKQCQRLHEMVLNPPTDVTGILPLNRTQWDDNHWSRRGFLGEGGEYDGESWCNNSRSWATSVACRNCNRGDFSSSYVMVRLPKISLALGRCSRSLN